MLNPLIFSRAFETPLLVHPAKARAFVAGFGPRIVGSAPIFEGFDAKVPDAAYRTAKPFASILDGSVPERIARSGRGYALRDGIAVIPVTGTLVHRGSWIAESSGATSYEGLAAQIEAAADDSQARGVVLEIDSFGGEALGVFSLTKTIREVAAVKPVRAIVAENALSAAYAIASQAEQIVVPPSGSVGSIGVIMMHVDMSAALEANGFRVTLIEAGAHKGAGNPYQPLPEDVREKFQGEAETLRSLFAAEVGAGRGERLSGDAALATEADTFMGEDAVAAGLADEVAHPKDAFRAFADELKSRGAVASRITAENGGKTMTTQTETPETQDVSQPHTAASAVPSAASEAPAPAAAPADARARIAGILDHTEAKGRERLARHLALNTDLSIEAAGAVLAAAPKAQPGLASRMAGENTELAVPQGDADAPGPRLADRVKLKVAG